MTARSIKIASTFLAVGIVLTGVYGCQKSAPPNVEPIVLRPVAPPRPELITAADSKINLFGELPHRQTIPFYTRAATALKQHTFVHEGADSDPTIDPTGRFLMFSSTRHSPNPDTYIKSVAGAAVTQLTSDPASDAQAVFSPNGKWVAFASDRAGNWDIWLVGIDGQQPVQITSGSSHDVHPTWSRDGKKIAYCSLPLQGGQWELWLAEATADAPKKFIGYGLFPEWSPVEDTLLYQRARERGGHWFSIWTVRLIDGEPRYPTEVAYSSDHAMILPTWSTDGKQIAYCAVESVPSMAHGLRHPLQTADIWMVDADGRGRVRLTDGHSSNFAPVWSPEGRIFFTSDRSGYENVWSLIPIRPPITGSQEEGVADMGRTDRPKTVVTSAGQ